MDGNTSAAEEEEFVDTLKAEMPDVFQNIGQNFEQIDGIDELIKQVTATKDVEKMQLAKAEVDDATNKVGESEALVVKLEQEIIEWHALKKLIKRDTELDDVEAAVKDMLLTCRTDRQKMEEEDNKIQKKLEKAGEDKDELQDLMSGIKEYFAELEEISKMLSDIKEEKNACFEKFNREVPREVQRERVIRRKNMPELGRNKSKKGAVEQPASEVESEQPNEMYYMLSVNCNHKKPINKLLKSLEGAKQAKAALDDKHGPLKESLSKFKSAPVYKAVKGDPVDELFAKHLNAAGLAVPVKRLASGKYLFGAKQILAKIINGKLVIRVGGGYMSAEEFLETYGRIEMMKLQKQEELNRSCCPEMSKTMTQSHSSLSVRSGTSSNVGKMDGKPAVGMADMKRMMKEQLLSVKTYGGEQDGRRSTKNLTSLGVLEKDFDLPKFGQCTASTPSMKSARKSAHGGLASLRPPTSLKTPSAYHSARGVKPNQDLAKKD